ncbi:acyltransferase family protein [Puerhibacterium sp. TATVAM-FAB25]|uniref:acyltransferase family protein n=1 Tax=Puerhibacterium sp. TATVAM-FAB25 TaxID=3093699 RepID=UPI00397A1DD6
MTATTAATGEAAASTGASTGAGTGASAGTTTGTATAEAGATADAGAAPGRGPARAGGRLLLLDGLRFAAAAAVVLYHFTATSTAGAYWQQRPADVFGPLNAASRYGWLAVELFFVLSGFVILLSAQGRTLAQYTGSRVGRLFPAYWVAVLVTVLLQQVWSGGRHSDASDTLLNLTMAPDVFGAAPVQVVFWTLLVELKFYVLVGVLLALGGLGRGRVVTFAVAWPVVGLVAQRAGWSGLADALVASYAPYFGVGMLLFLLRRSAARRAGSPATRAARRAGLRADAPVLAALAVDVALSLWHVADRADHASQLQGVAVSPAVAAAIVLASVAAVWLASAPRAAVRGPRLAAVLTVAGALTYPLYLVHTQFGYAVIDWMAPRAGVWLTLAAAVAVTVALAAVIHYAVERHAMRPLRRGVERALASVAARTVPPATTAPATTAAGLR